MIIVEREVNLESLSYTFIPEVFRDRVWGPFLTGFGIVYDPLIREFFSNAIMEGDQLNCWIRGTKFSVSPTSIQNLLQTCPIVLESSLPYDDRRTLIAEAVTNLGGKQKHLSIETMHTVDFSLEVRALAYIMFFNLYPVKNLTTLSQPRTLLLHDHFKKKEIEICAHMYYLLAKCIRKKKVQMTTFFGLNHEDSSR